MNPIKKERALYKSVIVVHLNLEFNRILNILKKMNIIEIFLLVQVTNTINIFSV